MADKIDNPIAWVDLEMTGLNVFKESIIEVAIIVTDGQLEKIIEGPNMVVHVDDKLLDDMDEWCQKTHGENGLTQAVKDSKISI